MSSVLVIIANIFEAEPYQMSLVQRDHVIQHLTAYAPHPSFRHSVLPRTANARPDHFDPTRFQKATHLAWRGQGLSKLLQNPIARRMPSGVEMENTTPMMLDDEETVQHTETQPGHGEEIEGGDHLPAV